MRDHDQAPSPTPPPEFDGSRLYAATASRRGRGRRRSPSEAAADVEAQYAFLHAMRAKIEHKLADPLEDEVQVEIATLMRLLVTMPWQSILEHRFFFELAFDLLASDQPNMVIVRSVRFELGEVKDRSGGGLIRVLTYASGNTPLHAVLSGLLVVIILSFLIIFMMVAGHGLIKLLHEKYTLVLPLFGGMQEHVLRQFMLLTHAAFIGSVISIVVRLSDFLSITNFNAILVFISVITRPFISVLFAILAFVMMKAGIISFLGIDLDGTKGAYLAWGIGFLSGFSERLARDFVLRSGSALGESNQLDTKPDK